MVACVRVVLLVVAITCYSLVWFGLDRRAHDLEAHEQRPHLKQQQKRSRNLRPLFNRPA